MTDNPHRRRFLKTVAAAALAPVADATADAGEPAAAAPAQALGDYVRARFGENLTATQLDAARTAINDTLRTADTIKRIALENAEEPAMVFLAEPEE